MLQMLNRDVVLQTEAPILIRPFLSLMTKSELHAVMVGGFATIAGGVLAAYIKFGVRFYCGVLAAYIKILLPILSELFVLKLFFAQLLINLLLHFFFHISLLE